MFYSSYNILNIHAILNCFIVLTIHSNDASNVIIHIFFLRVTQILEHILRQVLVLFLYSVVSDALFCCSDSIWICCYFGFNLLFGLWYAHCCMFSALLLQSVVQIVCCDSICSSDCNFCISIYDLSVRSVWMLFLLIQSLLVLHFPSTPHLDRFFLLFKPVHNLLSFSISCRDAVSLSTCPILLIFPSTTHFLSNFICVDFVLFQFQTAVQCLFCFYLNFTFCFDVLFLVIQCALSCNSMCSWDCGFCFKILWKLLVLFQSKLQIVRLFNVLLLSFETAVVHWLMTILEFILQIHFPLRIISYFMMNSERKTNQNFLFLFSRVFWVLFAVVLQPLNRQTKINVIN